jgi:hypothetical protein
LILPSKWDSGHGLLINAICCNLPLSFCCSQATYGFSFVHKVPPFPEQTRKLAERIAFIRETHYGNFWDFTPNMEHADTAYSTMALAAHTDTTYFSDPIGYVI